MTAIPTVSYTHLDVYKRQERIVKRLGKMPEGLQINTLVIDTNIPVNRMSALHVSYTHLPLLCIVASRYADAERSAARGQRSAKATTAASHPHSPIPISS